MSVAQQYPARTDTNGTTWYRPVRDPGMGMDQWGWTADPAQAHPDYLGWQAPTEIAVTITDGPCEPPPISPDITIKRVPSNPTTTKGPAMTDAPFAAAGSTPRTTEWSEYPLPPLPPAGTRYYPQYNGRRQYLLPKPDGGLPVGYSSATVVAKTLDDTYRLEMWGVRRKVESLMKLLDAALAPMAGVAGALATAEQTGEGNARAIELVRELIKAIPFDDLKTTNATIDLINNYNGGQDANEFGTAVHDWLGALDAGLIQLWQIPDMFRPWAVAYRHALARAGLVAVPQYIERVVLNDVGEETLAGQLDRIYRCVTTGELFGGDVKTSKAENLGYSWMTYVVQLDVYFRAPWIMALDGSGWEPMPPINRDMALLVHVPSDAPDKSQVIPYNLHTGDEYLATSIKARQHRSQAKYQVPGLTTPVPTAEALRYVAAYQAIQDARSVEDLNTIWGEYQDVWTDELTALGHTVARLFQ